METIEDESEDLIPVGCGIYPILRSLKKRGYVDSEKERERLTVRKGNRRTYYWITDRGMEVVMHQEQMRRSLLNWRPSEII